MFRQVIRQFDFATVGIGLCPFQFYLGAGAVDGGRIAAGTVFLDFPRPPLCLEICFCFNEILLQLLLHARLRGDAAFVHLELDAGFEHHLERVIAQLPRAGGDILHVDAAVVDGCGVVDDGGLGVSVVGGVFDDDIVFSGLYHDPLPDEFLRLHIAAGALSALNVGRQFLVGDAHSEFAPVADLLETVSLLLSSLILLPVTVLTTPSILVPIMDIVPLLISLLVLKISAFRQS